MCALMLICHLEKQCVNHCHCVTAAVKPTVLPEYPVAYFFDNSVIMFKWSPGHVTDDWGTFFQVVVPNHF